MCDKHWDKTLGSKTAHSPGAFQIVNNTVKVRNDTTNTSYVMLVLEEGKNVHTVCGEFYRNAGYDNT